MSKIDCRELIKAYHSVVSLYPNVPPMAFWRPWEIAFIKEYSTFNEGKTLDIACGDGKFAELALSSFDLDLYGCDIDPAVISLAEKSSMYSSVTVADARKLPYESETFDNVFTNCALEHFEDIEVVFQEINRVLKPGGKFIYTTITNKYIEWRPFKIAGMLPLLRNKIKRIQEGHLKIHNILNPLSSAEWETLNNKYNFQTIIHHEYINKIQTYVFLVMDQLWHTPWNKKLLGEHYMSSHKHDRKLHLLFDVLFRWISKYGNHEGSGVIFIAEKRMK